MKRVAFAVFVLLSLALVSSKPARAQAAAPKDEAIEKLKRSPTDGVLLMDAVMQQDKKKLFCGTIILRVVATDRVQPTFGSTQVYVSQKDPVGGIAALSPGRYTIQEISCPRQSRYRGAFAGFVVRPGEIVNGGTLVVDYEDGAFLSGKFKARTRVESLGPETIASLKKRAPVAYAKAIRRHVTPLMTAALPKRTTP